MCFFIKYIVSLKSGNSIGNYIIVVRGRTMVNIDGKCKGGNNKKGTEVCLLLMVKF